MESYCNNPIPGKNPRLLWLIKDIIEDLRERLVFHDHLVASVNDWKTQIREELKSDKNIIFIGVHNRQGYISSWRWIVDDYLTGELITKLGTKENIMDHWWIIIILTQLSRFTGCMQISHENISYFYEKKKTTIDRDTTMTKVK